MAHNVLQAKQRQSQLFQQQENAEILYSVNWAAELDTDVIVESTWVQNTGTGLVTEVINQANAGQIANSGFNGLTTRLVLGLPSILVAGDVITMHDILGTQQEMNDYYENGRFVILLSPSSQIIDIENNNGFTGIFNSGNVDLVSKEESYTTSARIKGNVGKHRITNKIRTESGNTMERQIILNVLSNTDQHYDDYCYTGRGGF